ncbi:MAG: hypothetical protein LH473_05540 [Chitinophagales bacterium]|nr:hypothetical protein [Chitinophagales bacterium]
MVAVNKVRAKELNGSLLKKIKQLAGEEKNAALTISIAKQVDSSGIEFKESKVWKDAEATNFLKGYANDEAEYFEADIKQPNTEYKQVKATLKTEQCHAEFISASYLLLR